MDWYMWQLWFVISIIRKKCTDSLDTSDFSGCYMGETTLHQPVCWRHIFCAHRTQYESVKSLIEAQVAHKALAYQLSASTAFGIAVAQLPHGKWTRQFHQRGLRSLLQVKTC